MKNMDTAVNKLVENALKEAFSNAGSKVTFEGSDNGAPYYVEMGFTYNDGDDAKRAQELAAKFPGLEVNKSPNGWPEVSGKLSSKEQMTRFYAVGCGSDMDTVVVELDEHPSGTGTSSYMAS